MGPLLQWENIDWTQEGWEETLESELSSFINVFHKISYQEANEKMEYVQKWHLNYLDFKAT